MFQIAHIFSHLLVGRAVGDNLVSACKIPFIVRFLRRCRQLQNQKAKAAEINPAAFDYIFLLMLRNYPFVANGD
jgi:hypothetical protein